MMIQTYSLVIALSNKYLKVIIQSLEAKIFTNKVEGLFYKIKKSNKTLAFWLNIFGSRYYIMISKYLLYQARPRL